MTDREQVEKIVMCYDCGRQYGDQYGFPDLIIPHWVWVRISPTGDEGGMLCPSCICGRLHKAGITCEAAFMSGPIESVSRPTMYVLRRIENLELRIERGDWKERAIGAAEERK